MVILNFDLLLVCLFLCLQLRQGDYEYSGRSSKISCWSAFFLSFIFFHFIFFFRHKHSVWGL
ncbi:uncharacterized protein BDW43DRAFT_261161 [Aspergillus alliaceus]|uniref:uncharacterized protein n=1 Tax=Petromyces alliaceus TaxID=209559 RepID=UPI0012A5E902|nr:uncharacterized protein BDW43DRAFT_261161 [Aspergillus alliaceus]KAB8239267.1 hypothetical protein BDW43DRAFT_261161 [Aspergillus alliaceus]